jgi:uncharacterized protein (DUF58 family)
MLVAMLIAGLNYNSNLALAFGFLMASVALVTMHHCHRNLLGLQVDVTTEVDAFAGREASFEFVLRNDSGVERRDVEIRCLAAAGIRSVPARWSEAVPVAVPVPRRGIVRIAQFELRTRYPFGWFPRLDLRAGALTAYVAPSPTDHERCRRWRDQDPALDRRLAATRISRACAPTEPGAAQAHGMEGARARR